MDRIYDRISRAALVLTVSVVAATGLITYSFMRWHSYDDTRERLWSQGVIVQERLQSVLASFAQEVKNLSTNLLMANALVDSEGRETYLEPFLKSYKIHAESGVALGLCNFEGVPLVKATERVSCRDYTGLVNTVINEGRPFTSFIGAKNEQASVVLAYPVYYPATGQPEGVLAARISLKTLMLRVSALTPPGTTLVLEGDRGKRQLWSGSPATRSEDLYWVSIPLTLPEPLEGLGLTLKVGVEAERITHSLRVLTLLYFGITIVLLIFAMYAASLLARKLAQPIAELSEAADRVTQKGQPPEAHITVERGAAEELHRLAGSYNTMLGRLRESYATLEQKVQDRTLELAEANERLKAEVAERMGAEEKVRDSLVEKELLLSEIHHRVKNNLNVVMALVSMQYKSVGDEGTRQFLQDTTQRIRSIALVHDHLYMSMDKGRINCREYLGQLTSGILESMSPASGRITLEVDSDSFCEINIAVPCGLIVNELITNAVKYAFPGTREGRIKVHLFVDEEGKGLIEVSDNGVGLPKAGADMQKIGKLGFDVVRGLAMQLGGTVEVSQPEGGQGLKVSIPFKSRGQASVRKSREGGGA